MMTEEIEILRERLNTMIMSENVTYEEVVKASQELDTLLVEYLRHSLLLRG